MQISSKYAKIYKRIKRAQGTTSFEKQYEEYQSRAWPFLNRTFTNPDTVWQKGLEYWFSKKSHRKPESPEDKMYIAKMVLDDIKNYRAKKEVPPYFEEYGQKRDRADKQRQTLESYDWDVSRAKKSFTPEEVVDMAKNVHDAESVMVWLEKWQRTPGALDFLVDKSLAGAVEQDKETKIRDKVNTAHYVQWLKDAGLGNLFDRDHFTQLWEEIGPFVRKLVDEARESGKL